MACRVKAGNSTDFAAEFSSPYGRPMAVNKFHANEMNVHADGFVEEVKRGGSLRADGVKDQSAHGGNRPEKLSGDVRFDCANDYKLGQSSDVAMAYLACRAICTSTSFTKRLLNDALVY